MSEKEGGESDGKRASASATDAAISSVKRSAAAAAAAPRGASSSVKTRIETRSPARRGTSSVKCPSTSGAERDGDRVGAVRVAPADSEETSTFEATAERSAPELEAYLVVDGDERRSCRSLGRGELGFLLFGLFVVVGVATAFVATATAGSKVTADDADGDSPALAGYRPHRSSNVAREAALVDLDARRIGELLPSDFASAEALHRDGGAVATLTLLPLAARVDAGSVVRSDAANGTRVVGRTIRNFQSGETRLSVYYEREVGSPACDIGSSDPDATEGCFREYGTISVHGEPFPLSYSYSVQNDNRKIDPLGKFSPQDDLELGDHPVLESYVKFYGRNDYAQHWMESAFGNASSTEFSRGNLDFSSLGELGRASAIQQGVVTLQIWMRVVETMERALSQCNERCAASDPDCNADALKTWDSAVAYYAGSASWDDGSGDGVLLFDLADEMCPLFSTCTAESDEPRGPSSVNIQVINAFQRAQGAIERARCPSVRDAVEEIATRMRIPLLQGLIHRAHLLGIEPSKKTAGAGAAFAASVLPMLHDCSPELASIVSDAMGLSEGPFADAGFYDVLFSVERLAICLQIRCEDIGGLYDSISGEYVGGSHPCADMADINTGEGSSANAFGWSWLVMTVVWCCAIVS